MSGSRMSKVSCSKTGVASHRDLSQDFFPSDPKLPAKKTEGRLTGAIFSICEVVAALVNCELVCKIKQYCCRAAEQEEWSILAGIRQR